MSNSRFSERIGAVKIDKTLQVNSISDELQNSIWNFFVAYVKETADEGKGERDFERLTWLHVCGAIAVFFRKVPTDELPYHTHELRNWVKDYFFHRRKNWHETYDFFEFFIDYYIELHRSSNDTQIIIEANRLLEREYSGYRFVNGMLVQITDSLELEQIGAVLTKAHQKGLSGAYEHIQNAIKQFAKRPDPDYRNSIKEAVSAIESVAKQITKKKSPNLEKALQHLSSKLESIPPNKKLHAALQEGFVKIYSYTSDDSGIRHALMDEPTVGFTEAKFMLVSCSAFVHFLIQKSEEAGLLKDQNG